MKTVGPPYSGKLNVRWDGKGMTYSPDNELRSHSFTLDIVILVDGHPKWSWLEQAIKKRLEQELAKLEVTLNREKTKVVDLSKKKSFNFLGFTYRRRETRKGKKWAEMKPKTTSRTKHLRKLKEIFRRRRSSPINKLIEEINPILRGWANYFRVGNAARCFSYVKNWVEKKGVREGMVKSV